MVNDEFRNWLIKECKLKNRSANDVIYRLNRGLSFIHVDMSTKQLDEILMLLARSEEFKSLTTTVKSQIRRSFKLYYEYKIIGN